MGTIRQRLIEAATRSVNLKVAPLKASSSIINCTLAQIILIKGAAEHMHFLSVLRKGCDMWALYCHLGNFV